MENLELLLFLWHIVHNVTLFTGLHLVISGGLRLYHRGFRQTKRKHLKHLKVTNSPTKVKPDHAISPRNLALFSITAGGISTLAQLGYNRLFLNPSHTQIERLFILSILIGVFWVIFLAMKYLEPRLNKRATTKRINKDFFAEPNKEIEKFNRLSEEQVSNKVERKVRPDIPLNPEFLASKVRDYFRRIEDYDDNPLRGVHHPGKGAIYLNGNDYLQLANHRSIKKAHAGAILKSLAGPQHSQVFIGMEETHPKRVFENQMANFMGFEACELTQSGYNSNVGLLQSISDPDIPVYLDAYVHFSFWDGIKLSGAGGHVFNHNNPHSLRSKISQYGKGVIVVDSIYSSIGTLAPLEEIAHIARDTGSVFVVDCSHSLGALGPGGAGLIAANHLSKYVHFITASLAKTFVSRAGVILSSFENVEFLRYTSSPAIFSSTVEPFEAIRCQEVLKVIKVADDRRDRLRTNARTLREGLKAIGVHHGSQSHIIPLFVGREDRKLVELMDHLEGRGIFGAGFVPPTTTRNKKLYRLSVHSELSEKDINFILEICEEYYLKNPPTAKGNVLREIVA